MTHPHSAGQNQSGPASLPHQGCPFRQDQVTLSNEDMRHGPAQLYKELRQQYGPVVPISLDPAGTQHGTPAWLVIGYAELREIGAREDLFSRDSRYWREWGEGRVPATWWLLPQIQHRDITRFADAPHHQPRRNALIHALSRIGQGQTRRLAAVHSDQLIDHFCALGEAEMIEEFARPLPLLVLARLFGLHSPADRARLLDAIHRMLTGGEQAQRADREITAILHHLVADRRLTPQDDLASYLIEAAPGLNDDAVREELWLMISAGAGASTYWIANVLQQLATDPPMRYALNNGSLPLDSVMRATLWNAPPAKNVMGAFAKQDLVLGGREIRAGDMLVLGLEGANHDPVLGAGAARDAFTVSNNGHMAFGIGAHRCPPAAHLLGELITSVALGRLWARCPQMTLAEPDKPLDWGPSFVVRALTALHVVFTESEPGGARRAPVPAFGGPEWNSPSPGSPPTSPPLTSWRSTGPSTGSTPTEATSPGRARPSGHSDRSSRWSSLMRFLRGQ